VPGPDDRELRGVQSVPYGTALHHSGQGQLNKMFIFGAKLNKTLRREIFFATMPDCSN
jgi:hypothetical protein